MPISSRSLPGTFRTKIRVVTGRTAEGSHAFQRPDQQGGTRYRTRMAEAVCLFRHQVNGSAINRFSKPGRLSPTTVRPSPAQLSEA